MKKFIVTIMVFLLTACAAGAPTPPPAVETVAPTVPEEPVPPEISETVPEPQEPIPEPDPRAETVTALLDQMTTEQLVGQLFFVRCPSTNQVEKLKEYQLGGYLLFLRDFQNSTGEWLTEEEFTAKIAEYQAASPIPLLIGVDEEGGAVARASRNPYLFDAKRRSPQTIYQIGGMAAILEDTLFYSTRLLELGINVNFAPVADVSTEADDFIFDRSFGRDAAATAVYIESVVEEMNAAGIGSVLKHFPGYGNNEDTHTGIAIDDRPMETFRTSDFLPFSAGIDAGAGAVLVSHNIVNCMDAALPASLSSAVISILREELGFGGVILTDDLAMDAVAQYAGDGSAPILALQAGVTMLVTTDFETQIPLVLAAIKQGDLSLDTIRAAAEKILLWKYDLGLLEVTP